MLKKNFKRLITFIKSSSERKKYNSEFMDYLHAQAKSLQRPIAVLGMFCWLDFAFNTDPKIHPEFPELLYFRLGLSVVCFIALIISFSEKWRGKGQGLLLFMGFYIYFSCSFFTGRIADDANYVSGLQIIILLCILMPVNRRLANIFLVFSIILFITSAIIYQPVLNTPSAKYSMNNLVLVYIIAFGMVFLSDRIKFSIFYDRLKLNESNRALNEARDALWGEMELAKKIQTVLLPSKPEIAGFEISAHMITADEVGGDYYDIINVAGMDWLIIGDVSGHGVPAGLIMMMVQTSIHTVLEGSGEIRPEELLVRVNKVITENIRKLNDDKYMTITVLSCFNDGRFYHSGLHQDIIIYRADSEKVELIETNGMWIGVMSDITGLSEESGFSLAPKDVMLLYTDGITEAWNKNLGSDATVEDMFGSDKLIEIFQENGKRTADEIKLSILDALEGYRFADDVTVMIVKRVG